MNTVQCKNLLNSAGTNLLNNTISIMSTCRLLRCNRPGHYGTQTIADAWTEIHGRIGWPWTWNQGTVHMSFNICWFLLRSHYTCVATEAFTVKLPGVMKANSNNYSRTLRRARWSSCWLARRESFLTSPSPSSSWRRPGLPLGPPLQRPTTADDTRKRSSVAGFTRLTR